MTGDLTKLDEDDGFGPIWKYVRTRVTVLSMIDLKDVITASKIESHLVLFPITDIFNEKSKMLREFKFPRGD